MAAVWVAQMGMLTARVTGILMVHSKAGKTVYQLE